MAMSNNLNAKGLYTFSNYYSQIPAGAQLVAENVNVDRDGIIEPRRGFKQLALLPSSVEPKQLLTYKDTILAHYNNSLAFYTGSAFDTFAGTLTEVETGLRVKGVESNGNFYFTSNDGIKKIAVTSSAEFNNLLTPSNAGGIKALNTNVALNYSTLGFLENNRKVGYRVLWATNDVNGNAILGSPSSFVEISNYSSTSCTVDITIQVPDEVTTDYYFQIYRTTTTDVAADLTDELKLVYEQAHDGSASYTINDIYPEDLRIQATSLYTNEFSGEGIAQANIAPPIAKDITTYKNTVFISNTESKSFLLNTFLGTNQLLSYRIISLSGGPTVTVTVSSTTGLVAGQEIALLGTNTYNIDGFYTIANVTPTTFEITIGGALPVGTMITGGAEAYPSHVLIDAYQYFFVGRRQKMNFVFTDDNPANYNGEYVIVYSAEDRVKYVLWFNQTGTTPPPNDPPNTDNASFIEIDISSIVASPTASDEIRQKFEDIVTSFVFDLEVVSTLVTPPDTSEIDTSSSGQSTNATSSSGFITASTTQKGIGVDSYSSEQTLTKRFAILSTYLSSASQIEESTKDLMRAINESDVGVYGYYISSQEGLPGEFTLESQNFGSTFTFDAYSNDMDQTFNIVLPQTSEIESFKNRLYYSKTDQPEAFTLASYIDVGPKDKAIKRIIGLRDSLFIFKEEGIYRLYGADSTNFVVTLFDSSANVTAPDTGTILNNQIYILTSQGVVSVSETGVSIISRPIENVMIKASTVPNYKTMSFGIASEPDRAYMIALPDNTDDIYATRIYRFNTFTQSWTSWIKSYSCGVVNPSEAKIYFGSATDSYVEVERKNLNRTDYSDREYNDKVLFERTLANNYTINTMDNLDVHDAIVQTQYLTIAQYNRFVNQLNTDTTLLPPTPIPTVSAGVNLSTAIASLRALLVSYDPAGTYPATSGSNDFAVLQTEFNALVVGANTSTGCAFINYMESEDTTQYEAHIVSFNNRTFSIVLDDDSPFIIGDIVHEKGIESTIVWAPETFGDVLMWKHVREGRIYFESTAFEGGSLGYSSDITGNFEDIEFGEEGNSDWGLNTWDGFTWGGDGLQYPFRTLIPRQKQRCRMIKTRFKHNYARDKFSVYGIGYVFEVTSERTNK